MKEQTPEKESNSWQEWFENCKKQIGIKVERTILEPPEGDQWIIKKDPWRRLQSIERVDGKFFRIVGFKGKYWQPAIEQITDPQDPEEREGIIIQFIDLASGDFLVQARIEMLSQNPGSVSLASTIQAGWSHYTSLEVPLLEYLGNIRTNKDVENLLDGFVTREVDATRISRSKNLYGIKFVEKKGLKNLPENYRWFTQQELTEAIKSGAPFNLHFEAPLRLYLTQILARNKIS